MKIISRIHISVRKRFVWYLISWSPIENFDLRRIGKFVPGDRGVVFSTKSHFWYLWPRWHYQPTAWGHHHHQFDVYNQANITHRPFGTFFSSPTCSSRDILSERRGFCAIWQLWYLGTGGFCQLSFLFQNPVWSLLRKDSNDRKKSIKNYQARIPKIWMPMDSKIRKAGVKYSNDKSFRAPHSRVNICSSWNPLISKRQISAWYL